jgi:hypothetical protein
MRFAKVVKLIAFCLALMGRRLQPISDWKPPNPEMIFREQQSWEVGGGRCRLTLWAEGRSVVLVVPDAYFRTSPEMLRLRTGWMIKKSAEGPYFIRNNVFPEDV